MSVYNGSDHVAEAVQSILAQTYPQIELVVVDDGSDDESASIVERFADPRVRVIREERVGRAAALNRAVNETRGSLVAFMDADDVAEPDRLEIQAAFLARHPDIGVVGVWMTITTLEGRPLRVKTTLLRDRELQRRLFVGSSIGGATSMVRRHVLDVFDGRPFRAEFAEDYDLWRRLASRTRFANISRPLYRYRMNPAGFSHRLNEQQRRLVRQISDAMWTEGCPIPWTTREFVQTLRFYRSVRSPLRRQLTREFVAGEWELAGELVRRGFRRQGAIVALRLAVFAPASVPIVWRAAVALELRADKLRSFIREPAR